MNEKNKRKNRAVGKRRSLQAWVRRFLRPVFSLFICVFFPPSFPAAQNLVQDTLKIDFGPAAASIGPAVFKIQDLRDESADVVCRTETKRYRWIPVDLAVCLENPLSEAIGGLFPAGPGPGKGPGLMIQIRDFELGRSGNSFLYPRYTLDASFVVFRKDTMGESSPAGQLLYETTVRIPPFGDNLKKGAEAALRKWRGSFVRDVNCITAAGPAALSKSPNFRAETNPIKPLFLMMGADAAFSGGIRTVDAEIFFSRREASSRFFRSGGYNIRVRDEKDLEAIEIGLSNDYLFHRPHPRILLRGKSLVLFGVNRWKNLASVPRHLADAFLFDCSLSQSVFFDPLDRRSVVLGAGVQENLDYLFSRDWRFRVAVLLHAGVKL